jgi:small subunit ribosomal protein S3
MGQKVIPISLRLNKNENWHSKWIVENKEYPKLLHFDLEIRKYFENIFNLKKLKLIKLNIKKISKNINIYVYIHENKKSKTLKIFNQTVNKILNQLNSSYREHSIKIFVKKVKLNDLQLLKDNLLEILYSVNKKNRLNSNIIKMVYRFSYAFYTKNINIISFFIKESLEKKKAHKKFIRDINNVLESFFYTFSNFIGYRLQFKGRLNGSKRKKKTVYQKGKIPLNTFKYDIKYHFNEFKTPSGICSIKFWVFIKKN